MSKLNPLECRLPLSVMALIVDQLRIERALRRLATMLRTSKWMYELAGPALYRKLVLDMDNRSYFNLLLPSRYGLMWNQLGREAIIAAEKERSAYYSKMVSCNCPSSPLQLSTQVSPSGPIAHVDLPSLFDTSPNPSIGPDYDEW